jgi:hypothetical protein
MKYLLCTLLITIGLSGQAKKFEGYVILKNNDTVKCQIIQSFTLVIGVDINSFQNGIKTAFKDGKKQSYLPEDINGFGIFTETDTLHFLPIKIKAYELFKGVKEKWFLMNIIDRGFIKVFYYIDVISGTGGNRRVPLFALQLSYNDVGQWLYKEKNESEKPNYRTFFKRFIPEYSAYFETLPDNSSLEEALDKIKSFNKTMRK